MKILKEFDFNNKRVLVRCDFNVPLSDKGEILDDFRIKEALATIKYLIDKKARVILISHLGRPEGKKIQEFSLVPVQKRLEELLGLPVKMIGDCIGEEVKEEAERMKAGEVILLENLRFYKQEEENDKKFAGSLAKLGDVYVNDAFGACHRAHASISAITEFLPSCAGLLLEKEISILSDLKNNPEKPLVAIIGGKKVETKTALINKISEIADLVLISGLIGKEAEDKNIILKFPNKVVGAVDEADTGKDIGPKTIELFKEKIKSAKTIFWNGPVGKIEEKEFSIGSEEIAKAIIESKAFSVIGGGETVEFINKIGLIGKFGHVSTGGGAMLSFLSGEEMPGISVLK